MQEFDTLLRFLEMPLHTADPVFEAFADLSAAVMRGAGPERFLYVPGTRPNRVLLTAHADTFWDVNRGYEPGEDHGAYFSEGVFRSRAHDRGLGADDRAGCAILWLLQDLGHSLLITDGEEQGRKGSKRLMNDPDHRDIAAEINEGHRFVMAFDRRNASDFKCYGVGTDEFRAYVTGFTGYEEPDRRHSSDIVSLCRKIAGVNLSVGYCDEHEPEERLVFAQWMRTMFIARSMLAQSDLPLFLLA